MDCLHSPSKVTLPVQLPPSSKSSLPLPNRGIPNSQIVLLLPNDMACNTRNAFPGTVYNNAHRALDLYGDNNIELDHRIYEVAVENLIRVLTDRLVEDVQYNTKGEKIGQ